MGGSGKTPQELRSKPEAAAWGPPQHPRRFTRNSSRMRRHPFPPISTGGLFCRFSLESDGTGRLRAATPFRLPFRKAPRSAPLQAGRWAPPGSAPAYGQPYSQPHSRPHGCFPSSSCVSLLGLGFGQVLPRQTNILVIICLPPQPRLERLPLPPVYFPVFSMAVDWIGFGYAALVTSGGLIGYAKAGSVPSLAAGLLFGSLAGLGAYQLSQNPSNVWISLKDTVPTACDCSLVLAMVQFPWTG
ncbi:uncharacterized protein LOC122179434 isoform X2 [Lagopus leucura]|uniref:uncharacterized protein LOC122179434 isoform X2 n=1 Tax=Lagopus leucura TaxID=30410 RepID=UPI001C664118|nr:uncharacterized protein LOC122179434 isoform X2 [Lagopus leucura]